MLMMDMKTMFSYQTDGANQAGSTNIMIQAKINIFKVQIVELDPRKSCPIYYKQVIEF